MAFEGDAVEEPLINGVLRGNLAVENDPTHDAIDQHGIDYLAEQFGPIYILSANELHLASGQTGNIIPLGRAYVVYNAFEVGEPVPAPGRRVRQVPMQPAVATGFDAINASETPVKMMINGQLYILRGEKLFDATGRLVK